MLHFEISYSGQIDGYEIISLSKDRIFEAGDTETPVMSHEVI
jgi:hypothetical protein